MKFRMVGTGSAFADMMINNSMLIENGPENFTLIDCGISVPRGLRLLQVPIKHVKHIVITHLHGDHVGGLERIGYDAKAFGYQKPRLYMPSQTLADKLWNNILSGQMGIWAGQEMKFGDYFDVIIIPQNKPCDIEGVQFTAFPTKHVEKMETYGYMMNKEVFYSADALLDRNMVENIGKHFKLILHDCQLHDYGVNNVHAWMGELMILSEDIQKKLLGMHYGEDFKEVWAERKPLFSYVERGKEYKI